MAARVGIAPVNAAENEPAIIISEPNLGTNLNKFVNAVRRSETAIRTAIFGLKHEFLSGIFGGSNGGAGGDVV